MPERILEILSLGVGVQSTTVFLKSCLGELPKLDCAVTADPGWERKKTYRYFEFLKKAGEQYGIPVHMVSRGNIRSDALESQTQGARNGANGRWGSLPYFVRNADGSQGMVKRQCTSEYKIEPIERFIKIEVLGIGHKKRWPTTRVVRHWQGISSDEFSRIRYPVVSKQRVIGRNLMGDPIKGKCDVPVRWKSNLYPLLGREMFNDKTHVSGLFPILDREACEVWLTEHGYPIPVRSACVGCPFHSDDEWAEIQREDPDEFAEACEFDERLRNAAGMKGELFLHRSCVPLRSVLFTGGDEDNVSNQECLGMCGV